MASEGEAGHRGAGRKEARRRPADPGLESRIDTFMGEFRMLTPGVAALFGFQLTVAFQSSFEQLPAGLKALNFASLVLTAMAFLLLLVPAHHHRFIHRLREDEEFMRFAKRFIGAGSAFVPLAIALTIALQAIRAFDSMAWGAVAGAGTLLLFGAGWWVYPWAHTHRREDGHAGQGARPGPGRRPRRRPRQGQVAQVARLRRP